MPLNQPTLFDAEPAPWELDDAAEQLVASVVFPTGPGQEFDYRVRDELRGEIEIGRRVRAPFGRGERNVLGYCVRLESRTVGPRRLKELAGVVDEPRLFTPALMRLSAWIKDYYLAPWAQVLETVVPSGVRAQAGTRLVTFLSLPPEVRERAAELKLPKKQAEIVAYLAARTQPVSSAALASAVGCTSAPIQSLRKKGLLIAETRRMGQTVPVAAAVLLEDHLALNDEQRVALDAILAALASGKHQTLLLHGVTGSGKTEVYIHAIQEVVHFGRQAIVLVPEISLTPQTQQRFRARFGSVAVLHSLMSPVERNRQWERIARGEVTVVVGARSAIFAPTPHLGLIVLDEEHEGSFKQDTLPRYHARDVALRRAADEGVPLVLGSATPSLESYYRATQGEYQLLRLKRRVLDRPLPDVATIDLRTETLAVGRDGGRGAISRPLRMAMQRTLADDGQVILLLNRRGFSTHIQCPACGQVVRCPHCDIALTHHKSDETALCHYCDYETPRPRTCPACNYAGIRFSGQGTQRLEAEIRELFPNDRCLRMDTDTMRKPGSHEKALAGFRDGEVRILLGTQMIAKGLDFPNVTLVGVINADTALHLPDFRAAERTMQLLVQVAGRTGRGERGGRVLVQTFSPEHAAIRSAVRHDYEGFAKAELPLRGALSYPPQASMVRIVVRGPLQAPAAAFAGHVGDLLKAELQARAPAARVLGPAPAPLARLRGNFRFQIQLQGLDGQALRDAARAATGKLKPPDDVQWQVDVDPLDML